MICNGNIHRDAGVLAAYLMSRKGNDCEPELVELTAFEGMSLDFALRAMEASAIGTRCEAPLYHAQISSAPGEHMTREQIMEAVNLYEENMGYEGLARAVVVHTKNGQEHVHIVWNRIDPATGKARDFKHDYKKQEKTALELEQRFGFKRTPRGHFDENGIPYSRDNPKPKQGQSQQQSKGEQAQEERGAKPKLERQEEITRLWHATRTGRDFRTALDIAGYTLAKGDRRDFVVVDRAGEAHSLARCVKGATAKDIAARLADVSVTSIPTVQEVREAMRRTATERSPVTQGRDETVLDMETARPPDQATQRPLEGRPDPTTQPPWVDHNQRDRNPNAEADAALLSLTRHHSTFTRADLERYARHETKTLQDYEALVAAVQSHPDRVELGEDRIGEERFTSKAMLETELRMENHAAELSKQRKHYVPLKVQDAVPGIERLSDEQAKAYRHILEGESLKLVEGYAGTGKSFMLGAARKALVAAGYRVHGAALSGIAAEGLQTGSQIESRTLHSLLGKLDAGTLVLDKRDVIVLDEAGMVGSRQMSALVAHIEKAGAKLVLVGDTEQLQSIEAGGAFRALKERHGAAVMTDVRRQGEQWQQRATQEFASERTPEALDRYRKHGMLHEEHTRDEAKDTMIRDWTTARAEHPLDRQMMLAYTRADVADLNERARAIFRAEGRLGEDHQVMTTDRDGHAHRTTLAAGDRIYFMKNDTRLNVKNGTLATVTDISGKALSVQLDDGRKLRFDTRTYNTLQHAYAATVHKSQGVTVDRTYMLASRFVDRHAAYVGMTRHRQRADMYYGKDEFRDFDRLAAKLSRDHRKDTTLDYLARPEVTPTLRDAATRLWHGITGAFRSRNEPTRPPRVEPTFKREEVVRKPEVRVEPPKVDPKHAREQVRARDELRRQNEVPVQEQRGPQQTR